MGVPDAQCFNWREMVNNVYREQRFCRLCLGNTLELVWDLGEQYLMDCVDDDDNGVTAPVVIVECSRCGLAQLAHTVDRERLYRHYWYRSGTSGTMRLALDAIANAAVGEVHEGGGVEQVVDIGANDGYLLSCFPPEWYKIGVEPSQIQPEGADTKIQNYFSYEHVAAGLDGPAKVVTSIAMFYDVDRPLDFMQDVADILHPQGVWINQMNYLPSCVSNNAFDFISHEHLTYWTLRTFDAALSKVGLEVYKAEKLQINGGTIRMYIQHIGTRPKVGSDVHWSDSPVNWRGFRARVDDNGARLVSLMAGKRVFAYGASTRGNSLLQYYGINSDQLECAADKDERKWGKRMAGTGIPITSEDTARQMQPDAFLVLPYSYAYEFVERERQYLERGGKFIIPLPNATVLGAEALSYPP